MFGFGKFNIPTQAMKAGALALSFKSTDKRMARAAVMTIMRTSSPRAHRIRFNSRDMRFGNEVTWLFGPDRAGRSDALDLLLKEASRDGRRSVLISRDKARTNPRTWAVGDWFGMQFDTLREHDEMVSILSEYMGDPGFPHLRIILPPLEGSASDQDDGLHAVLGTLESSGLRDGIIAFDDQDLCRSPVMTEVIRSCAAASGNRVIIAEQDKDLVGKGMIAPEDAVVIMMTEKHTTDGLKRQPGEAVLYLGGKSESVLFKYEDRKELSLDPDMVKLEKRICERSPCRTIAYHERLELIARACGYRSWHAAQGRK